MCCAPLSVCLSIFGAVTDLCKELARDSRCTEKPAANENLESMVIPTEFLTASPISQTVAEVQRKLLREYEQNFAELPEQQKMDKLCSNERWLFEEYRQRTILHHTW